MVNIQIHFCLLHSPCCSWERTISPSKFLLETLPTIHRLTSYLQQINFQFSEFLIHLLNFILLFVKIKPNKHKTASTDLMQTNLILVRVITFLTKKTQISYVRQQPTSFLTHTSCGIVTSIYIVEKRLFKKLRIHRLMT